MASRKNHTLKLAGILLALVLVTSCFVGGTFAKYVTSGTGNGKFSPDANCTRAQIVTLLYRANG